MLERAIFGSRQLCLHRDKPKREDVLRDTLTNQRLLVHDAIDYT
jgi:hypothetical protein